MTAEPLYQEVYPSYSEWYRLNGLNLHVRHWPRPGKPQLLLLPGWLDCSAGWQFLVDCLPPLWDIYALDWRGMGFSEGITQGYYDRALMLADLHQLITAISPAAPLYILGHSLGGMLLSVYAAACPHKVKAMILAEAFGTADDNDAEKIKRLQTFLTASGGAETLSPPRDEESYIQHLQRHNPRLSLSQTRYLAAFLLKKQDQKTVLRADWRHRISQPFAFNSDFYKVFWQGIKSPLLWVQGDDVAHNRYLRQLAAGLEQRYELLGRPRRVILKDCGHMLHWEAPAALAAAVTSFLTEDRA